jgi:hypothetical protein
MEERLNNILLLSYNHILYTGYFKLLFQATLDES